LGAVHVTPHVLAEHVAVPPVDVHAWPHDPQLAVLLVVSISQPLEAR
jgi:hypothetical protein